MFMHAFGSFDAVDAQDAHIRCVSRSLCSPFRKRSKRLGIVT